MSVIEVSRFIPVAREKVHALLSDVEAHRSGAAAALAWRCMVASPAVPQRPRPLGRDANASRVVGAFREKP